MVYYDQSEKQQYQASNDRQRRLQLNAMGPKLYEAAVGIFVLFKDF